MSVPVSHEDYDVRVEAVQLLTRFGNSSDAQSLIGVARSNEGILQQLAARGAMIVSGSAPEIAVALLETADEVLSVASNVLCKRSSVV